MVVTRIAVFSLVVLCCLQTRVTSQTTKEQALDKRLQFYEDSVLKSQNDAVNVFGEAKTDQFIDISEAAYQRIAQISKLSELFETKLEALLTNDEGKWFATDEDTVRLFIRFDADSLLISDRSLKKRRQRLVAAVNSLKKYNSSQGKFDPSKSDAVEAILTDSVWVRDMLGKLKKRIAIMDQMVSEVPAGKNVSALPTLFEAKQKLIANDARRSQKKIIDSEKLAEQLGNEQEADAVFKRSMENSTAMTEFKNKLAAHKRQLMEMEYERKIDEVEERIGDLSHEKLIDYLKSRRVQDLLAPFTTPDEVLFGAHHEMLKIKELDPRPASLSRIASLGHGKLLLPQRSSMQEFIRLVNINATGRPKWPVHHQQWQSADGSFKDIDGNKVNPYREAQRILREHGQTLVELKMLVK